jgi:hypothetical protein
MLVLAGVGAGVLAGGSSGARQTQRTIGLITEGGAGGFVDHFETGSKSAATALGDHLAVAEANGALAQISAIKSLVARHAAAIGVPSRSSDREAGSSGFGACACRWHRDVVLRTAPSQQRLGRPDQFDTSRAGARRRARRTDEPARTESVTRWSRHRLRLGKKPRRSNLEESGIAELARDAGERRRVGRSDAAQGAPRIDGTLIGTAGARFVRFSRSLLIDRTAARQSRPFSVSRATWRRSLRRSRA